MSDGESICNMPEKESSCVFKRVKAYGCKSIFTTSWQIDGETVGTVADFIFWAPKSLQMVTAAMKVKDAFSLEGKLWPT